MTFDQFVLKYLAKDVDAQLFCCNYVILCHAIDDIIDEQKVDTEHVLKTFELTAVVYNNLFYLRNFSMLYPIVKIASNSYADSVLMERSNSPWKKLHSDVLRSVANEVILCCVELLEGYDVRREASMILREISYKSHHDKDGVAI